MIGICTDSHSHLPVELARQWGVEVVPLTMTVDDIDYLEGVNLDPDAFYGHFTDDRRPTVTSTPPSSGQFADAYETLLARGCTEILSIHVCSSASRVAASARLAARCVPVPVRVVDTGTAGFGVSCCVWQAVDAIAGGASLDQAAQVAGQLAPAIGNVFVMDAWRASQHGIPVLSWSHDRFNTLSTAVDLVDAVNIMAEYTIGCGEALRVAVGHTDDASIALSHALASAVSESAHVIEVVRYRIGPSVGCHSGPGTAGCFVFPCS